MKIIGFVGMPGSGKSVASDVARSMGIRVVVMGDVIRSEAKARGLEPTDANHGMVGDELRRIEGPAAIARRCLVGVNHCDVVVVDGIRSIDEVRYFREAAEEFHLIEVFAAPQTRLHRIAARGRSDDIMSLKQHDLGEMHQAAPQWETISERPHPASQDEDEDIKIVSSCCDVLRAAAESLERRECRELGWGMCEAIAAADMRISSEGTLEEFQMRVRDLLDRLAGC